MLEILLGKLPEAIFFSLFMIYTKNLKEKRLFFTFLMILQYFILDNFFYFNVGFQISYTFMTFLILKLLYKEKSQITDIFTFTICSIIMGIIEEIMYLIICKTINNYIVFVILVRIIYILFFILFHKKLYNIQKLYKKLWNRNDLNHSKIKSTTFRCINIVIFNFMFYILNICMIFMIIQNGGE